MAEGSSSVLAVHRPLCPDGQEALALPCDKPCEQRKRSFVLAATILASAMAFIDGSVVNIALPTLQADLGASFAMLQWVVHAYALVLGSVILVGGGLGDRYGRRRIFIAGILVFALASLACAAAPTVTALVFARGLQGLGAALLVPQSLAIIAASFPKEVRGRAIGIWSGASAITTSLGPPLGGFLIDALDWRAIFWINLPLSLVTLWLALVYVPESRNEKAEGGLDWKGAFIAILAFGALTLGLTQLSENEGTAAYLFILISLGFAGIVLFVVVEKKTPNPLVPPSLFANRGFSGANLMTLFLYGALSGVLFLLPFDLIARRELSASQVGLTMLPFGLVIGLFSRFSGNWADKQGPPAPLVTGALVVAFATLLFALGRPDYLTGVLLPVVILAGGFAIVVAPLTTAVINAAPETQSGAASSVNNAASRLAGLFSVASLGALATTIYLRKAAGAGIGEDLRFGILPSSGDAGRALLEAAFVDAYTSAMWLAALAAIAAAAVAFAMIPRPAPVK